VRVSHVCFVCAQVLIVHDTVVPKVETVFLVVSGTSDDPSLYVLTPFLDLWVLGDYRRFSLDCAPHVRPPIRRSDRLPKLINTRQSRHLEREQGRDSVSNWRMGDQRYILHSR
jgi:hypothetical protein